MERALGEDAVRRTREEVAVRFRMSETTPGIAELEQRGALDDYAASLFAKGWED